MAKFPEKEGLGVGEASADAARDLGLDISGEKSALRPAGDRLVDKKTEEALNLAKAQGVSPQIIEEAKASLETGDKANLSPETIAMLQDLGIEGLKSSEAVTKILGSDGKQFDPFAATEAAEEIFGSGEENIVD